MYMVRKRFMYFNVPTTTKLHLNRGGNGCYCFSPARLVKKAEKRAGNYIVERLLNVLIKPMTERKITAL